jgi:hypothetical protein
MLTPMFVAPVTSWGRRLLAALRVAVCVVATAALSGCQQAASHEIYHELLYILDTDRSRPDSHAQLLVLDPQRKAIVKRYQGAEPIDFALSADGKRLYLARSQETPHGVNGQLDVIDTVNGAVMATASNPDLWVAKGPYRNSEMAFSADGHWLYVYKLTPGPGNTVSENVAIFDTAVNRFLPDTISLSKCGASLLVPWPNARALSVLCFVTEDLRTVQFSDQGVPTSQLPVIPIPHDWGRRRVGTAFVSGENEVTVLMTDGKYSKFNVQNGTAVQEGEIVFSPPLTPAGWHPGTPGAEHVPSLGRRVIGSRVQQSQGSLYILLSRSDLYMHAADAIAVLDAKTLQQEAIFEPKSSFWSSSWNLLWSGAIGDGGRRLYLLGVESKGGTVRVLRLPDGKEIDAIKGVGTTPSIIALSP